jgi:hypothetical protein
MNGKGIATSYKNSEGEIYTIRLDKKLDSFVLHSYYLDDK